MQLEVSEPEVSRSDLDQGHVTSRDENNTSVAATRSTAVIGGEDTGKADKR